MKASSKDKASAKIHKAAGKAKIETARTTGDTGLELEGRFERVVGEVEKKVARIEKKVGV